jgi:putative glutamine amidotransferase
LQPIIGITTETDLDKGRVYSSAYNEVARAVEAAGGLPLYVPTQLAEPTLRAIYSRIDGLLLPGGPDVEPAQYGEQPHPKLSAVDPARDATELPLARWAVEDDMPVFAICRGHQLLNVALGGTLVQDMAAVLGDGLLAPHARPAFTDRTALTHRVIVADNSRLANLLDTQATDVNSLHHQAVARLAPGLVPVAHTTDGVVEASEMPDKTFVLSVQWHPEDLYTTQQPMLRLFQAFVEAARERMTANLRHL